LSIPLIILLVSMDLFLDGVIVDSGKFSCLTEPDPSYHGVRFTKIAGNPAYIVKARVTLLRDIVATFRPFNSSLFLQGLETFSLRVERHVENAFKVVKFLQHYTQVERVNYSSLSNSPYFP
jgi:O-acetylhomoserine (thiol)-lyase